MDYVFAFTLKNCFTQKLEKLVEIWLKVNSSSHNVVHKVSLFTIGRPSTQKLEGVDYPAKYRFINLIFLFFPYISLQPNPTTF